MTGLTIMMVVGMVAALALGLMVRGPLERRTVGGELAMGLAMVDVCLLGDRLLPPLTWALLLVLAAAVLTFGIARARARDPDGSTHSEWDVVHPVGLLVASVLVVSHGSRVGEWSGIEPAHHQHLDAASGMQWGLLIVTGSLWLAALRAGSGAKPLSRASRIASPSSLLAMAAMPIAG